MAATSKSSLACVSLLGAVWLALLAGCQPSGERANGPRIAITTSYLQAGARDLLGEDVSVLRLAEPGTCPGHFDIRPSQVQDLRRCRALLRFDFQKSLDAKFAGAGTNGPAVAEIALRSGMCVPDSYLSVCRQTAEHFVAFGLLSRAEADTRLQAIAARLDALARDATNRVARAGPGGDAIMHRRRDSSRLV